MVLFGAHLNPAAGPEIYTEPPGHIEMLESPAAASRLFATPALVKHTRSSRMVRLNNAAALGQFLARYKRMPQVDESAAVEWMRRTSAPRFSSVAKIDEWLRDTDRPLFDTIVQQETLKETFHPNYNMLYRVSTVDSFEPLVGKWHNEILALMRAGKIPEDRLESLITLWGAGTVIDRSQGSPSFAFRKPSHLGQRAILADHVIFAASDEEALATLVETDVDATKRIILSAEDAVEAAGHLGPDAANDPGPDAAPPGSARVVSDSGDEMTVEVEASRNALLFVADGWYPNWRAEVDGVAAPVYRANYAYRAVPVGAGNHRVTFTYRPHEFYAGLAVTIAGVAALVATLLARGGNKETAPALG
jgi:hypothetical protein